MARLACHLKSAIRLLEIPLVRGRCLMKSRNLLILVHALVLAYPPSPSVPELSR